MCTDFENKVIEIYNDYDKSNAIVEYSQKERKDNLGNTYIDVSYSGTLRKVQEQVCKIYNDVDMEKVMRATELLIRTLSYRNGPQLTLPEEFEKIKLVQELNDEYKRKPVKYFTFELVVE